MQCPEPSTSSSRTTAHAPRANMTGRPIVTPSQDMVIGMYYLSEYDEEAKGAGRIFGSPEEAAHDRSHP